MLLWRQNGDALRSPAVMCKPLHRGWVCSAGGGTNADPEPTKAPSSDTNEYNPRRQSIFVFVFDSYGRPTLLPITVLGLGSRQRDVLKRC